VSRAQTTTDRKAASLTGTSAATMAGDFLAPVFNGLGGAEILPLNHPTLGRMLIRDSISSDYQVRFARSRCFHIRSPDAKARAGHDAASSPERRL
jgi:hypothetical protein